ncbi:MAG: hypothetical protein NTU44_02765 [Bacteroidetes bacterium]|nr:hypothetical protein [Bacteroidota bacterium]
MPFLTLKELVVRPFQEAPAANHNLRRSHDRNSEERRVFLFYKAGDKDRILSMVNIIKSLRLNIFIDYIESGVLESSGPEVIAKIRTRLYQSEKAILLATPQPIDLNGIPLDFGLNGKFQFTRKVAIFPITENPDRWNERDMFRIYGYVQKKYSFFNFPDDWIVVFPEGDRMTLKEWLTS